MKKSFSTLAIAGVITGRLLEAGRYDDIRELMDHFCPGIFSIGAVAMAPVVAKEIVRQIPALARLPEYAPPVEAYAQQVIVLFGSKLELEGPLKTTPDEVSNAYDALTRSKS